MMMTTTTVMMMMMMMIMMMIIIIIIISGALAVAKEPKYLNICSDQAMDWTVHGSKPRRDKRFSFLQNGQTVLKPPCLPFNG